MKTRKLSTIVVLMINYSVIILPAVLFRIGAMIVLLPLTCLLPLAILNFYCSSSVRNLFWLNINMVIASTLAALLPGLLYLHYVYNDGLGRALILLESIVVFSIALICAVISVIVKYKKKQ